MAKLNLGCGFDRRDGFVNADNFPECQPDVLMDIEAAPWPARSMTRAGWSGSGWEKSRGKSFAPGRANAGTS
jgi:hypothetical protein